MLFQPGFLGAFPQLCVGSVTSFPLLRTRITFGSFRLDLELEFSLVLIVGQEFWWWLVESPSSPQSPLGRQGTFCSYLCGFFHNWNIWVPLQLFSSNRLLCESLKTWCIVKCLRSKKLSVKIFGSCGTAPKCSACSIQSSLTCRTLSWFGWFPRFGVLFSASHGKLVAYFPAFRTAGC